MAWTFQQWILCNVLTSIGVLIITTVVMLIMLCYFPKGFYAVVARLFRIKRCLIDVNHTIVKYNSELSSSHGHHHDISHLSQKVTHTIKRAKKIHTSSTDDTTSNNQRSDPKTTEKRRIWPSSETVIEMNEHNPVRTSAHNHVTKRHFQRVGRSAKTQANQRNLASNGKSASYTKRHTALNVPEDHPLHPAYQRVILNVYGKYLPLRKKRNRFLILMLTTVVISTTILAFGEGCILASITAYQSGPCPPQGEMECFYGSNATYFQCTVEEVINLPPSILSATCFRWVAPHLDVSDVLNQIGVCTGLLTALGSFAEVFLRLLLYVHQQRRCVGNGMRRVLEKTVGVNNITQPFCQCCIQFPIRIPPC